MLSAVAVMKIIVVDSHNEALPHWFEEYLRLKTPLVVVRFDRHHDMHHGCPPLPAREGRGIFDYLSRLAPYIPEYAKRKLNEGNYTCPAFHYGIVGALYHFNPAHDSIGAYGRVSDQTLINSPKTTIMTSLRSGKRINRIIWDSNFTKIILHGGKAIPVSQKMSLESLECDLKESRFPLIICFDLDGLYAMDDKGPPKRTVIKRLERVNKVLDAISSPALACIARSQTPRAYVPSEIVDHLQWAVLDILKRKFIDSDSQIEPSRARSVKI